MNRKIGAAGEMNVLDRAVNVVRERRLPSAIYQLRDRWKESVPRKVLDMGRESLLRASLKQPQAAIGALPAIARSGDFKSSPEASLLERALDAAVNEPSPLPAEIRAIKGMSGQKYRAFINHLVRGHPAPRYLEIGSWAGSTAAAALYGNRVSALCVDNWSQFGGPRETFFANVERVLSEHISFEFRESDFRTIDYSKIGTFSIYLFDGPHEEKDQYDGVMRAQPALASRFILIVDDWNWRAVRVGTFRALADAACRIEASCEVRTTADDSHPLVSDGDSDWHNGYFFAVLRKG